MTFTARAFAHDKDGNLVKFEANDVESYGQAIAMVKEATGSERALCVVDNEPLAAEVPIETEKEQKAA